jgi:hypothetical protein
VDKLTSALSPLLWMFQKATHKNFKLLAGPSGKLDGVLSEVDEKLSADRITFIHPRRL